MLEDPPQSRSLPIGGFEPRRRTLPHLAPLEFPNQSTVIFVTQVIGGRRPLLARREAVETILRVWKRADHWLVGRYVFMPDHIHFFCAPVSETALKTWMFFWRSQATREWPWLEEKPIWQKDFFDRQLRSSESYAGKWSYMLENPVRKGLVSEAAAWPWQGEVHRLTWHERG